MGEAIRMAEVVVAAVGVAKARPVMVKAVLKGYAVTNVKVLVTRLRIAGAPVRIRTRQ